MKFCLKMLENCNFLKGTHLAFHIKFIEATVHTLLAPQSGALRRGAYRDFNTNTQPLMDFEHSSLYIQKH